MKAYADAPELKANVLQEWQERFLAAIPIGADLSLVYDRFMLWTLGDENHGIIRHSDSSEIKAVRSLFQRKVDGGEVTKEEWRAAANAAAAAYADADAAYAAAAYVTAYVAAYVAAYAADDADYVAAADVADAYAADVADADAYAAYAAAADAAYVRFSDKLIELLKNAPF